MFARSIDSTLCFHHDPEFLWLNEHFHVQPTGDGNLLAMWTAERFVPRVQNYTVHLPDGRFVCVMRTNTGQIWYTVSSDQGVT